MTGVTPNAQNDDNPVEEVIADDNRESARGRYGWLSLVVAALFGLFYAYDLFEAVSNLLGLPAYYDAAGLGSENIPWAVLWLGVVLPIALFLLAFIIGRRRNVGQKAVIFLLGLALSAGLAIGVLALEEQLRPILISI